MLNILLSAYACLPDEGSEPSNGWNWIQFTGRNTNIWVITRAANKDRIELALNTRPLRNVQWIYYDLPKWARFWKKARRGERLYYFLWQLCIYFIIRKLNQKENIQIIHHITFACYWMPCFVSFLPIPFIWGPVGGGESAPSSFYVHAPLHAKLYKVLRDLARFLGEHNLFVRMTARNTVLGLAATAETALRMRRIGVRDVRIMPSVALSINDISHLNEAHYRVSRQFRLISIGRLLFWKGFHLGLEAYAIFQRNHPESEYWIIGSGPEYSALRRQTKELGLDSNVKFFGNLPRRDVYDKIKESDLLLHPSLHDSGGYVTLEAMAAGLVVICLELGGPPVQVTKKTGFVVPAYNPQQVISRIVQILETIVLQPQVREKMGDEARLRVSANFNWATKTSMAARFYQQIIDDKKQIYKNTDKL